MDLSTLLSTEIWTFEDRINIIKQGPKLRIQELKRTVIGEQSFIAR